MKVSETTPYITKDGSVIRELIHPAAGVDSSMSLAQAIVPRGTLTHLHVHRASEEIYHVVKGRGAMTLGEKTFDIAGGDSVLIRPGTPHRLKNTGEEDLVVLCCCHPPYSHEDTELMP